MIISNISQTSTHGLPLGLISTQEALNLPEVQSMLQRLSEYQLGIFMPHMHNEQTGGFQSLGDDVVQVESGLEVSFKAAKEIAIQKNSFLPVGWFWRADQSAPIAVCEMVSNGSATDGERHADHKMKSKS